MKEANKRLLALDVLRGVTIAGMVLVNNPGSWGKMYAPLAHAQWHGLTPCDLVFPFFMFIMGISTCISLRKYDYEWSATTALKIFRRSFAIYGIGLALAWFSLSLRTWNSLAVEELSFWSRLGNSLWTFDRIRLTGVLARLALCYCATALIVISMKHKHVPRLIGGMLLAYFCILLFGNGFEYNETNILSRVDRAVLGFKHLYNDNGIDPEGLLSSIPAIAHVLIGFCCGKWLLELKDINEKIQRLFLVGTILTFSGFLLSYGCPINKKIWSPTYVLATCGMASSLLAVLIWIIDVKGKKTWSRFFEVFGVNPLFLFVLGSMTGILMANIRVSLGEQTVSLQRYIYSELFARLQRYIYSELFAPLLSDYPGSLVYSLLIVFFVWSIGYVLYKKQIYIKI